MFVLSRFSCVQLFQPLWTVAHQVPLSMEFSSQEYWSGLPFPTPGDLPITGIKPKLLHYGQILYYLCHQESSMDSYLKNQLPLGRFISVHTFSLYILFQFTFTHSLISHIHTHMHTHMYVVVYLLSRVWIFVTPWTPTRLLYPRYFLGKNTRVNSRSLL